MNPLAQRLAERAGHPELIELLSEHLAGTELNTLLLEVFQRRAQNLSPGALMHHYRTNRFVRPSSADAIGMRRFSLEWMQSAHEAGFGMIELSPVCPLGTCSVVATAHQNKVVSALRGTEVVADATNVLALESVLRRSEQQYPAAAMHCGAVHRHVRSQEIPKVKGFSAHFAVLALSTAGRDTGDFNFEKAAVLHHFRFFNQEFKRLGLGPVSFHLIPAGTSGIRDRLNQTMIEFLRREMPDSRIERAPEQARQSYYHALQYKIRITMPGGAEIEIADGGFTNWTQILSGNQKERFLISGMGLELLYKLLNGQM
ncbi:MAG: hypothetical protein SFV22_18210 [Saprospiraceae bacterium]|nr:hypothetical protein [Saprospiraceae bacterium]